jgi:hypothetical protein
MFVNANSICPIVSPHTFICVTIDMCEFTITMSFTFTPVTYVDCTIRPFLLPITISKATFPLSFINYTSTKFKWRPVYSCLIDIKFIFGHCFLCLNSCKVFVRSLFT